MKHHYDIVDHLSKQGIDSWKIACYNVGLVRIYLPEYRLAVPQFAEQAIEAMARAIIALQR